MSGSKVSVAVGLDHVPEAIRSLCTLSSPDYIDLFTITTPWATDMTAEHWARAVLERAPLSRRNVRALWRVMGLRLGPRHSPDHVQGWRIVERGDGWLRAETASWYMTGQVICLVEDGRVSVSLSLRYHWPVARLVWAFVAGPHQRAVPVMLVQAVRLVESDRTAATA